MQTQTTKEKKKSAKNNPQRQSQEFNTQKKRNPQTPKSPKYAKPPCTFPPLEPLLLFRIPDPKLPLPTSSLALLPTA